MKYWRTKFSTPVRFESTTQLIGALHNKSVMYQSLHAQDEAIHWNALKCVLHVPHALHGYFFYFSSNHTNGLWRYCIYGIVVSKTLERQQKKDQLFKPQG